jgi:hypothetical protein
MVYSDTPKCAPECTLLSCQSFLMKFEGLLSHSNVGCGLSMERVYAECGVLTLSGMERSHVPTLTGGPFLLH